MKNSLISISKMAKLHHLSRQTLIHYDKIGLFKPILVDKNGYRYYSAGQIPILKEICIMKAYGLSLDLVKQIISMEDNEETRQALIQKQKDNLVEIQRLKVANSEISKRLLFYEHLQRAKEQLNQPFITRRKRSYAMLQPFPIEKGSAYYDMLIQEFMNVWERFGEIDLLSCLSFGLLFDSSVFEGRLESSIFVEVEEPDSLCSYVIEEGSYAGIFRKGFLEDGRELGQLLEFIKNEGYEMVGDVLDTCILDHTLEINEEYKGLCLTQVRVEKIKRK